MTEMLAESINSESESRSEGPGKRLAEARVRLGMSRERVAGDLRLHADLIRALEEDDYDRLPPAIFVIGYLRNYSRLVGIPEEEVINCYEHRNFEPPPLVNQGSQAQVRSSDLPVRLVTYLVIAGLGVLLVLWWFSQKGDSEAEAPPESVSELAESTADAEAPVPLSVVPDTAAPEASGEVSPVDGSGMAETVTEDSSVVSEAVPAPASNEATTTEEPTQPEMTLTFSADSWVDIKDRTGKTLANGIYTAGRTVTLHGAAPFRVFLGYAKGVSIEYNGEQFVHDSYRRGNVARFRVGQSSDNWLRTEGE